MQKTFDPKQIETKWYKQWEKDNLFSPSGQGLPYCIMLPPPNVTGRLHMCHGFQQTLMDALIRFHRMKGHNTLWKAGLDHAGIATQMVVERRLEAQNLIRHQLGRERFVKEIWKWKEESGSIIEDQIKRLGASIDWNRTCFTMDPSLSRSTQEAFIRLYDEGLIYRGKRLVNWDPILCTAISDLEVSSEEEPWHLWYLRYPLDNGNGFVTVATTRPETLFGDMAVAVHPKDTRYAHLIGQQVKLPLTDRLIPIIGDDSIDPEFGSGCVKTTPAHDFNDYQIGERHHLEKINIFTLQGTLNENVPFPYQGLDRPTAQQKVIVSLKQQDLIEKIEPYTRKVPRSTRSNAIVEPLLTDQWFVKTKPLAKAAIEVVEEGKIKFIPENWTKTYLQWLYNIEDWCISRQLWWGHRIPAFYDAQGNIYVGTDENSVRKKYKLSVETTLTQDEDVLDTWFTSALWPFATLGWPDSTADLKTFYPTSVLITGFDIIFFWVARMIMMGLHFLKEIPFKEVYITGLIRDSHGQKMSKSKGNILDPLDLIDGISLAKLIEKRTHGMMLPQLKEKIEADTRKEFPNGILSFGTDALRFTFCALANTSRNINFDLGRIEGYRNFCNKLWNAARFALMNIPENQVLSPGKLTVVDQWILSQLQRTIQSVHHYFSQYRFDLLAQTLYEFIWNHYCDWYLEFSKCTLQDKHNPTSGTQHTLVSVLEISLRLLHPVTPFITEEIWADIAPLLGISQKTIMKQSYPRFSEKLLDEEAEKQILFLQKMIMAIRNVRSEINVSPSKRIELLLTDGTAEDKKIIQSTQPWLCSLAKIHTIQWVDPKSLPTATATTQCESLKIYIPLEGLIDKKVEIQRLQKEIEKLEQEKQKSEQKLNNENYVNKAPAEIVQKEKDRLQNFLENLKQLKNNLQKLQ